MYAYIVMYLYLYEVLLKLIELLNTTLTINMKMTHSACIVHIIQCTYDLPMPVLFFKITDRTTNIACLTQITISLTHISRVISSIKI